MSTHDTREGADMTRRLEQLRSEATTWAELANTRRETMRQAATRLRRVASHLPLGPLVEGPPLVVAWPDGEVDPEVLLTIVDWFERYAVTASEHMGSLAQLREDVQATRRVLGLDGP